MLWRRGPRRFRAPLARATIMSSAHCQRPPAAATQALDAMGVDRGAVHAGGWAATRREFGKALQPLLASFQGALRPPTEHAPGGGPAAEASPQLVCLAEERAPAMLEYNLEGGKLTRGVMCVNAARHLCEWQGRPFGDELLLRSIACGWAIEALQAAALVLDDVMRRADGSPTRRGKQSWFQVSGVGHKAITDGLVVESLAYHLLRAHLEGELRRRVEALFRRMSRRMQLGQMVDMELAGAAPPTGLQERFTRARYGDLVLLKTSEYTFRLPAEVALLVCGVEQPPALQLAARLAEALGLLCQAQDDFLDCFGDSAATGKQGTDIAEGKCTFLIVAALERADERQHEALRRHYGGRGAEDVAAVVRVYDELGLRAYFREEERRLVGEVRALLGEVEGCLPPAMFADVLGRLEGRTR